MSMASTHDNTAPPNSIHPLRQKAPIALSVAYADGQTVPARNYNLIQNLSGIEISELKDALAYAEHQLKVTQAEKD